MELVAHSIHMACVQNSRPKGLYAVGPVGLEELISHLGCEEGPSTRTNILRLNANEK